MLFRSFGFLPDDGIELIKYENNLIIYENGAGSDNENDNDHENGDGDNHGNESKIKYFNNDILIRDKVSSGNISDMFPESKGMFFENVLPQNRVRSLSAHVQRIRSHKSVAKIWNMKNSKSESENKNEKDRKSTRLNSSHPSISRMPSSA